MVLLSDILNIEREELLSLWIADKINAIIGNDKNIADKALKTIIDNRNEIKTIHTLINGDSRNLSLMPDKSVHLIITSPPYWQLKDYGNDGQIGFMIVTKAISTI